MGGASFYVLLEKTNVPRYPQQVVEERGSGRYASIGRAIRVANVSHPGLYSAIFAFYINIIEIDPDEALPGGTVGEILWLREADSAQGAFDEEEGGKDIALDECRISIDASRIIRTDANTR